MRMGVVDIVRCIAISCVLCSMNSDQVIGKGNEVLSEEGEAQPNIILILADDMGWGDFGANWNATSDTPNLDKLAKSGLRLTDFHSGASVCAPSRAALLTGRLGLRTGVVSNFGDQARGGLPSNETTLAEMLRGAGYRTALFGKWHLGVTKGHHPLDHGFESYLGVPYSVDMGCTDEPTGANLPKCGPCPHENDLTDDVKLWSTCFMDLGLPLMRDRDIAHQPLKLTELAQNYARFAEDFILRGGTRPKEQPFLLMAALAHVHVPLAAGPPFSKDYPAPLRATLRELDWLVARLAATATTIKRLPPYRDTLLWFMSDNGPWEEKCDLAGTAGPFAGDWQRRAESQGGGGGGSASKQTVWEGGHRVPAFVHWPSRIKGGRVSDSLASATDVLPTLAALLQVELPANRRFDGLDISALLTGDSGAVDTMPCDEPTEITCERVLFHPNSGAAGEPGEIGAVRIGDHKVVYYSGGSRTCGGAQGPAVRLHPPLVFDLARDPAEAFPLPAGEAAGWHDRAAAALRSFTEDVRADNCSRADYHPDRAARPCCNADSAICRCPWD